MEPFFPVLGWQEVELELRTSWDWRGCAVGEGAETSEHLLLVTLAKFCSCGLFLEKLGVFHCFLEVCSGISRVTSVSGAGNTSQRGQGLLFWDQRRSQNLSLQGHDQVRGIFKAAASLSHVLSVGE